MDEQWELHIGKQFSFTAIFQRRFGNRMLLIDIRRVDGALFRDHLFLPYTARFRRLRLNRGDIVLMRGKVNRYYKKHRSEQHIPRGMGKLMPKLEITNINLIELLRQ